jgi:hypothetical protein
VFVSWEVLIALRYGESHFLHSFHSQSGSIVRYFKLILPLVGILGGIAPGITLLGLTALGLSRRGVAGGGMTMVLGYLLLGCVPERWATLPANSVSGLDQLTLNTLIFGIFGITVCATMGLVIWRLIYHRPSQEVAGQAPENDSFLLSAEAHSHQRKTDCFLLLWLALELAGYFTLSPFPAVRRVLGIVVVGTLLVGRLAAGQCRSQWRARLVGGVVLGNIILGLGLTAINLCDARAEAVGAERAARYVRQWHPDAVIWFTTEWLTTKTWAGFEFYAERARMKMLGGQTGSFPRPGDWLVIPYRPANKLPEVNLSQIRSIPVSQVQVTDWLPFRTIPCYYSRRTAVEHHEGPRFVVGIYLLP